MHIFSLENKEALMSYLERELHSRLGVKASSLKTKKAHKRQSTVKTSRVFHRPLDSLPKQPVLLKSGGVVDVPCFVVDLCQSISNHFDTEGIFRKAGSSARQREIKAHFEAGAPILGDFHEVDLANILKLFLRELPEPLIPHHFQDVFAKAQKQSNELMLLLCMLLPSSNLHLLAYLSEFLQDVGSHSKCNLMPASNLAIVLAPSFMPLQERHGKIANHAQQHDHNIKTLEILIHDFKEIGEIPMALGYQLGIIEDEKSDELASNASLDSVGSTRKSRKRRSGSLTKMFNGLRKMVGGGSNARIASPSQDDCVTPATPLIKSAKKRKAETPAPGAFSAKRKLEVLQSMPNGAMLSGTPAKPISMQPMPPETPAQSIFYVTPPVNFIPNPQKTIKKSPHPQGLKIKQKSRFFTPRSKSESILQRVIGATEQRKPRLSFGSKKVSKKQLVKAPKLSPPKPIEQDKFEVPQNPSRALKRKKSWSSLGGSWGRNMRRLAPVTFTDTPLLNSPYAPRLRNKLTVGLGGATAKVDLSPSSSSLNLQSQYEEIKSKVVNLENQLNEVLSQAEMEADVSATGHSASFVQTEYEKTKEDSEPFSKCLSTDQLAKRLSRELKIRRSGENKVIRSPSARKIGTLRRRSKESGRIVRSTSSRSPRGAVPQQRSLKRGRPNSVVSGLTQPSPGLLQKSAVNPSPSTLFSTTLSQHCPMQMGTPKADSPMWNPAVEEKKKSPHFAVPMSPFVGPLTRSVVRRANSDSRTESPMHLQMRKTPSCGSIPREDLWLDARSFISQATPGHLDSVGRPSIAEIKMKRAGMVLASLKLFENSPDEKKQLKRLSTERIKDNSPLISPSGRKSLNRRFSVGRTPANVVTPERASKSTNAKAENHPLPSAWEKENLSSPLDSLKMIKNQFSPQMEIPAGLKETIYDVCTPKPVPQVKSPLAALDVNKFNSTPKHYPTIKKPLSVRPNIASALRRTPYHAFATPCGSTPMMATPLRRSPRLNPMHLAFSP